VKAAYAVFDALQDTILNRFSQEIREELQGIEFIQ
jgi:hypothetical protein